MCNEQTSVWQCPCLWCGVSVRKMQYDEVSTAAIDETLTYLGRRTCFWQKQNPVYSRSHEKRLRERRRPCAVNNCTYLDQFLSKELQKVQIGKWPWDCFTKIMSCYRTFITKQNPLLNFICFYIFCFLKNANIHFCIIKDITSWHTVAMSLWGILMLRVFKY